MVIVSALDERRDRADIVLALQPTNINALDEGAAARIRKIFPQDNLNK